MKEKDYSWDVIKLGRIAKLFFTIDNKGISSGETGGTSVCISWEQLEKVAVVYKNRLIRNCRIFFVLVGENQQLVIIPENEEKIKKPLFVKLAELPGFNKEVFEPGFAPLFYEWDNQVTAWQKEKSPPGPGDGKKCEERISTVYRWIDFSGPEKLLDFAKQLFTRLDPGMKNFPALTTWQSSKKKPKQDAQLWGTYEQGIWLTTRKRFVLVDGVETKVTENLQTGSYGLAAGRDFQLSLFRERLYIPCLQLRINGFYEENREITADFQKKFQKAVTVLPDFVAEEERALTESTALRIFEESERRADRLLQSDPANQIALLAKACCLVDKQLVSNNRKPGIIKRAIKMLEKIRKKLPGNGEAWFQEGQAHKMLGHKKKAIEAYIKTLEIFPHHHLAHFYLCELLLLQKKFPETIKACEMALQNVPRRQPALFGADYRKTIEAIKADAEEALETLSLLNENTPLTDDEKEIHSLFTYIINNPYQLEPVSKLLQLVKKGRSISAYTDKLEKLRWTHLSAFSSEIYTILNTHFQNSGEEPLLEIKKTGHPRGSWHITSVAWRNLHNPAQAEYRAIRSAGVCGVCGSSNVKLIHSLGREDVEWAIGCDDPSLLDHIEEFGDYGDEEIECLDCGKFTIYECGGEIGMMAGS